MDWRFFAGGGAMMATGIITAIIFGAYITSGTLEELNQYHALVQLGGIIGSIGFLLLLVSFGLNRRRSSASGKDMLTKTD